MPDTAMDDKSVKKQAYCMKCRAKVDIKGPKKITMKNGRPATTGTCKKCGTKVFRIEKSSPSRSKSASEILTG